MRDGDSGYFFRYASRLRTKAARSLPAVSMLCCSSCSGLCFACAVDFEVVASSGAVSADGSWSPPACADAEQSSAQKTIAVQAAVTIFVPCGNRRTRREGKVIALILRAWKGNWRDFIKSRVKLTRSRALLTLNSRGRDESCRKRYALPRVLRPCRSVRVACVCLVPQ